MKGIVFTEFIEMVDDKFGMQTTETMITDAQLSHKGSYTAVGTYPHDELVSMVKALSNITSIEIPDLIITFGRYFFNVLYKGYPHFFDDIHDSFTLFENIDNYIHIEVRKLYPDAELPKFSHQRLKPNELLLTYESPRRLGTFAHGLILGCGEHFKENLTIDSKDLSTPEMGKIEFHITKNA